MKRPVLSERSGSWGVLKAVPILVLALVASALAFGGRPAAVSAAVSALDAWPATPQMTGTTGDPASVTFSVSSGEDRLMVVLVVCYNSGGTNGQTFSATYGTKALTQAYLQNSNEYQTWMGYLAEGDIVSRTSNTVTVTVTGPHTAVRAYIASYEGVDQAAPVAAADGTFVYDMNNMPIGGPLEVDAYGYGIYGWAGTAGVTRSTDTEAYVEHSDVDDATFNCGAASKAFAGAATTNPSVAWSTYVRASISFITLNPLLNPVPVASSISPDNCTYGDPGFTMTVYGSDFMDVSVVRVDGSARTTTYVSPTELNAVILPGDLRPAGTRLITVVNPAPGGGSSNARALTVLKRDLVVTATGVDKVYDGTAAAAVTLATDALAGDNATAAYGGASFPDENVGSGKTVTVAGISIAGPDADNYNLLSTTGSTTANITARGLTVSAIAISKIYDGTTDVAAILITDALAGDLVAATYTGASFFDKNVGNDKAVTVSGISISGADAANYTLLNTTAAAAAGIVARALTFDGVTGDTRIYDGTAAATVDLSGASLAGLVPGDVVEADCSAAAASFADKHAGTAKTITVTGVVLTGADAGNYALAPPSATAGITLRELSISGIAGAGKVYDGTTSAMVYLAAASLDGVLPGDTVGVDYSAAAAAFATSNAGKARTITVTGLVLTGADAGNYRLMPLTVTGDIAPRGLTITASDLTKIHGEEVVFEGTEFTVSGLVGGDTVTGVALSSEGAGAGAGKAGSPYDIVPGAAAGTGLENYDITYVHGRLTVAPAGNANWRLIGGSIAGLLGLLLLSGWLVLWRRGNRDRQEPVG